MFVSNTHSRLWSQPRVAGNDSQGLLVITYCEKEQDVTGDGGQVEVGTTFLGQISLF